MLKSNLCNYSGAHILAKRIITITGQGVHDAARQAEERIKAVLFKILWTIHWLRKQNK